MVLKYGVKMKGEDGVQWAIAGRSQTKLDAFKAQLSNELQMESIHDIPTLIVDTTQPDTMPTLVQDTRVVATTAGPYSYHGSPVVEFCAKFGTHYVDITGEIPWIKQMMVRYQSTAQGTGAMIVPFCGHDSVPWDLLATTLQETLQAECQDEMKSLACWDDFIGGFAGGTLATLVAVVEGHLPPDPVTDLDLFRRTPDGEEREYSAIKDLPLVPQKSTSPWDKDLFSSSGKKYWTVPFFMADVNANVVSWSRALQQTGFKKMVYSEKWRLPDFKTAATLYAGMVMLITSLLNPFTKSVAKCLFTPPGGGPSIELMENKHYLQILAEAVGEKGNKVEAALYFPKDAGCLETSRMLIESALSLALEHDTLPTQKGGFWSPAAALGNTLLQRILNTGSTLDIRVLKKE